jgi:hypothetical protein
VLVLAACIAPGCSEDASAPAAPLAAQRDVAQLFAQAIFSGNADAARALLVKRDDAALSWIVTRAAAPWKPRSASVRLPGKRSGPRWIFRFVGTHTHKDGRFERVRGRILVVLAGSSKRAAVEFFLVKNEEVRFSTHHDSVLLPSNR